MTFQEAKQQVPRARGSASSEVAELNACINALL